MARPRRRTTTPQYSAADAPEQTPRTEKAARGLFSTASPVKRKIAFGLSWATAGVILGVVANLTGVASWFGINMEPDDKAAGPAPTVTVTVTATQGATATPSPTSSLNASNWNQAPSYDLAQLRVPFLFAKTDPLTNHQYDLDAIKKQSETSPADDTDLTYRSYGKSAHLEPWASGKAMGRFPGGSPTAESCLDAVERAGVEEWKPSEGAVGDGLCFVTGKSNVAYVKITSVQQIATQDIENKGPELKAEITLWKRNN